MIDTRLAPYGAFAIRAALGVMFIAHAYLKIAVFTVPGFAGFLTQTGFPAFLAWPIILAELIGGIAILLGVYGRAVSVALLPVLLGAVLVHAPNGWLFNAPNGGWEYPAFLAVAAVGACSDRRRRLGFEARHDVHAACCLAPAPGRLTQRRSWNGRASLRGHSCFSGRSSTNETDPRPAPPAA